MVAAFGLTRLDSYFGSLHASRAFSILTWQYRLDEQT